MTRRALAIFALPVLALLPRASLPAQTPGPTVAVAGLPAGATVRAASAGALVTGRVRNAGPDTLLLVLRDGAAARLALAEVDTIWRAGRATGRGAAIGAVVGGVALAGLGVLVVQGLCDTSGGCGDDTRQAALGGGVVGVVAGGVLGAGLGSLVRTWRRVYP